MIDLAKLIAAAVIVLGLVLFARVADAVEPKSERTQVWEGYYCAAANQLYHAYQSEHGPRDVESKFWHGMLMLKYGRLKDNWWALRPTVCEHQAVSVQERIDELRDEYDECHSMERNRLKGYDRNLMHLIQESFKADIAKGNWPLEPTRPIVVYDPTCEATR